MFTPEELKTANAKGDELLKDAVIEREVRQQLEKAAEAYAEEHSEENLKQVHNAIKTIKAERQAELDKPEGERDDAIVKDYDKYLRQAEAQLREMDPEVNFFGEDLFGEEGEEGEDSEMKKVA